MGKNSCIIALTMALLPSAAWAADNEGQEETASPCAISVPIPADMLENNPRFIIFGEIHGTDTSPEVFGDAVCGQSEERPVLVQLELPSQWGAFANSYVQTGDEAELQKLLDTPLFTWPDGYDGRASAALVGLIRRLRAAVEDGREISVAGFQPDWHMIEPQHYYELAMAQSMTQNAAQHSNAVNMVLVGNYHARRKRLDGDNPSAASFLRAQDFISLTACPEGGQASVMFESGEAKMDLSDKGLDLPRGIYPAAIFSDKSGEQDGFYCAGRSATASPRAVPARVIAE